MLYFSRTFMKSAAFMLIYLGRDALKRVVALLLIICLALSLISCASNQPSSLMAEQTDENPTETGSDTPPEATANSEYGSNAAVSVLSSVAYLLMTQTYYMAL